MERPQQRADCIDQARPCPWLGCRYHLWLDVNARSGAIKLSIGHSTKPVEHTNGRSRRKRDQWPPLAVAQARQGRKATASQLAHLERVTVQLLEWLDSGLPCCALDVADQGGLTLDNIGAVLGVTRERARQIEAIGMEKLRVFGHRRLNP